MKTLLSSIFGLFMILSMSSQVGVNNPTPEQALDVNGKVKLTNDATTPTAGTMRYDATSSDFEGYNGSQWNSFTHSRSSGLPSNPVPIFGYGSTFSNNSNLGSTMFKRWSDGSSFNQVPEGKYLIITSVHFESQSIMSADATFNINMGPVNEMTEYPNYQTGARQFQGRGYMNNIDSHSSQSPIFILRSGQYLTYRNITTTGALIQVSGFLVNDLNY